jgi:hypothetical protein
MILVIIHGRLGMAEKDIGICPDIFQFRLLGLDSGGVSNGLLRKYFWERLSNDIFKERLLPVCLLT